MTGIAIYAVIVVSLVVAIYRAPAVAVAPVLCMFGLEQWAQAMSPFFVKNNTLTNVIVGSLVLFGLLRASFRGRDISLNYSVVGWLVLLLFLYAFTSLLWASNTETGLTLWSKRLPYLVTILVLTPLLIRSVTDFKTMCWSTLFLGTAVVILLLIFGEWDGRKVVLSDTLNERGANPLAVGQIAGYIALAALFLRYERAALIQGILKWLVVGACLMLAAKSGSRGQFFGVLLVASILLPFASPSGGVRRAFWGVAGVSAMLGLAAWALGNFAESERWSSEGMERSGSDRWRAITTVLGHWYTSPDVLFFGLGNSASYDVRVLGGYPHNVPLEILSEQGFVGFGLFLVIIYLATRSLIRVYRVVKHDEAHRRALLVLGGWLFYELFLSLKQGSMLGSGLLVFLFATILCQYERAIFTSVVFPPQRKLSPITT